MNAAQDTARLRELLSRTHQAQCELLNGDSSAYAELYEHSFDTTLSGPFGGMYKGWLEIAPRLAAVAALFVRGAGENELEVVSATLTGDIAVVVARETNLLQLKTQAGPLTWRLRITNIYRPGPRGWRLLHRHADPLADRRSIEETFAAPPEL